MEVVFHPIVVFGINSFISMIVISLKTTIQLVVFFCCNIIIDML